MSLSEFQERKKKNHRKLRLESSSRQRALIPIVDDVQPIPRILKSIAAAIKSNEGNKRIGKE